MKPSFTVAIIFVCSAPSGFASEGLFYFAAYQCNAVDVSKRMIETSAGTNSDSVFVRTDAAQSHAGDYAFANRT